MSDTFEFEGLENVIAECEKLIGSDEVEKVSKKILKDLASKAQLNVKGKLPRSEDVALSGRNGSRTFIHSGDVVPVSGVKNKNGRLYVVVGWEQDDNSPYFYTKFNEFGTSSRPPIPIFLETSKDINDKLQKVGVEEYTKLLSFLER